MEQDNSLKTYLEQMTIMQQQQLQILADMNAKQSHESSLQQQQLNAMQKLSFQTQMQQNFNPSAYSNYAQSYMPPMVPLSPAAQQQSQQFKEYARQVINPKNTYGFLDSIIPSPSRVSNSTATLLAIDYGSRVAQAGIAGIGAAAGMASSWLIGSLLPGVLGFGTSMLGGAVVGSIVDIAIKEMKKQSAYEQFLMRESYKFINPNESKNDRDTAGFSIAEARKAATDLRTMNKDFYIKDEEMMSLVRKYTEGGLLKDVHDYKTFKEKVASLTKNVKAGALLLNETYDSIAELLSAFKKAGIDQKDFNKIISDFKVLGSYMGVNAGDLQRDFLNIVSSNNTGTGNSNKIGLSRITDTALYTDAWYEYLKEKTNRTPQEDIQSNLIVNLGGSEKTSEYLYNIQENLIDSNDKFTRVALTFFDYDTANKQFLFNRVKFNEFLKSGSDYNTLIEEYAAKMNDLAQSGNQNAILDWQNNAPNYIKNTLKEGELTKMITEVIHSFARSSGLNEANLDFTQVLGLMGVSDNNIKNLLGGFLQFREQKGDDYGRIMKLQSIWEQQNVEVRSQIPSIKDLVSQKWDAVKESIYKPFRFIKEDIEDALLGISDRWYNTSERIMTKPDKYYTIKSNIKSLNVEDVHKNFEDANKTISLIGIKFKDLANKGYSVDQNLSTFLNKTLESSIKSISYTRDVIDRDSWQFVDKTISKFKDIIIKSAADADISESILAALVKWDQKDNKKKETNENIKSMADKLGKLMFKYGGNQNMALAALIGGDETKSQIDNALKELGYNITELVKNGQQGVLNAIDLKDLGITLSKELKNAIETIMKKDIGNEETKKQTSVSNKSEIEDFLNKKITQFSDVTADDLNKIIDLYTADKPDSVMRGQGQAFYNAAKSAGLDPLFLVSLAGHETGWGTSKFAKDRYNFFGIGAVDSNPDKAYSYNDKTLEQALIEQSKWIKKNYVDKGQDTVYTLFWNNGKHEYSSDKHEPNDPLSEDEKIARIMKDSQKLIGKKIGVLDDNNTVVINPFIKFDTIQVNKDKNGKNMSFINSNYVSAPTSKYNNNSLNEIFDIMNFQNGLSITEEQYKQAHDQMEKEILESGGFWDKFRGYQLWKQYKYAEKGKVSGYVILKKGTDLYEANLERAKKRFEDFQNERSGGKYNQIKELENEYNKIVKDGGGNGKLSSYQESLVLKMVGQKMGITENQFKNIGDYQLAIIEAAQNFYKTNYDAMSNFMLNQTDPNRYKLSESGQRFKNLDMTDKAATLELMKVLEKLDVVMQGVENKKISELNKKVVVADVVEGRTIYSKTVTTDVSRDIFTKDEKTKLQHLFRDENGNIYYDPYNENKNQKMTHSDLLEWQKNGAVIDYFSSVREAVNNYVKTDSGKKSGIKELGEGATYEELINSTKESYKNMIKESFDFASQLNKVKNTLTHSDILTDTQINNIMSAIKNKDIDTLKKIRDDLNKQGRTDPDIKTSNVTDQINDLIKLIDKLSGLKTDDFEKILNQIEELQKTSADVGKGGKMLFGLLEESGKIKLDEKIQEIIGPELKNLKVTTNQIFEALQYGGKVTDKNGYVIATIDAKNMQTLTEKIAIAMSDTIKDKLKTSDDINKLKESANLMKNGDYIIKKLDELIQVKEIESGGKLNKEDLKKVKQEEERLQNEIIQQYVIGLTEMGKKTEEMSDKAGQLGDTAQKFVSTFAEYDKAIGEAIDIMNKRINNLKPAYNPNTSTSFKPTDTTLGNFSHNPYGGFVGF
ncbi:MAG: glucosaminidase domain-containing protein [Clostridia bacterium]|nr:glucosaminidase domain-containing protein [Clostridia bacterium]